MEIVKEAEGQVQEQAEEQVQDQVVDQTQKRQRIQNPRWDRGRKEKLGWKKTLSK